MQDKEAEANIANEITARFAAREREIQQQALTALLASEGGRSLLWWCLQVGKWGTQPFTGNDPTTNFHCGELNVGQQIFARIIETEPAGFLRMQEEKINAERARDIAIARAQADRAGGDFSSRGEAGGDYPGEARRDEN